MAVGLDDPQRQPPAASRDGLKVGGHQASCASIDTIMTALYFHVLRPQDRVAVKPHASPIFHAIQYLLGSQTLRAAADFRALGGAQSLSVAHQGRGRRGFFHGLGRPRRGDDGVRQSRAGLSAVHGWMPTEREGRMIAIVGDAELDEGNIYEALIEGWKQDIRNCWWIVDYNRQSLDAVVPDRLFGRIESMFAAVGWRVVTLKYGKKLRGGFARPGGEALRDWIDACPNYLYSRAGVQGRRGLARASDARSRRRRRASQAARRP